MTKKITKKRKIKQRSQCVNDEYLPFKRKEHINSPIEMNGSFNNFDVNINILNVTLIIITIIIIKTMMMMIIIIIIIIIMKNQS